jgi:TetR/AcrR family transcriptional regulator
MFMQQRDAILTKKKLLSVAENLFSEKGYYPVTLKEIGKMSGCSSALVAYYFGSKQELYQAVVNRQLDGIHYLWNETEAINAAPLDKVIFFLTHLLKKQLDPSGHLDLVYKEVYSPSGLLDDSLWHHILSMGDNLKILLNQAVKAGDLKPFKREIELSYITFTIEALTETLYLVKDRSITLNPENRPIEEVLESLIRFILKPMMTGKESAAS